MSGLRKKSVTGVLWTSAETIGVRLTSFISFLVLARVLGKEDFGLLALAAVYISFLELVIKVGITDAVIQRDNLSELHKDTAYWTTAALGVISILLSIAIAPVAANWSGEAELEPIIYCLAIGLIPISLSRVQQGLLLRDLQFRKLAIRRLISTISGAVVGVTMALNGYGVWSLVAQQLVERFIELLSLYWVTRWFPRFRFSWDAFSDLWTFVSRILALNILQFAGANADRFLIGQFFGIAALGVYVVGKRIVEVILGIVRVVVVRVALSVFSRVQSDVERLFEGSVAVARIIALFGFPVMGLFIIYGEDITVAAFGEKWRDGGVICQIVAIGGMMRLATLFMQPLLKSTGHPGSLVVANLGLITTSIVFSVAMVNYGLNAFIGGWVSGQMAFGGLLIYSVVKILDYPMARIFKQYAGPVLALICSWALVTNVDSISALYLEDPIALTLFRVMLFVFSYGAFLLLVSFSTVKQAYLDASVLFHSK